MDLILTDSQHHKLNIFNRGPSGTSQINTCNVVNKSMSIDHNGECYLCMCEGWLPVPVGNVLDFESFESVFDSTTGKHLRDDVAQKKYTYCATELCGIAHEDTDSAYSIYVNIDRSCNLACPSCRREKEMLSEGPEFEVKLKQIKQILQWLHNTDKDIHVILSGNGDPLASLVTRPLLKNWPINKHPIVLHTNGLLIEKQLKDQPVLNQIKLFRISIDAGSAEVYPLVRKGGTWDVLVRNLDFLKSINAKTELVYTIQNTNLNDLENFCNLVDHYNFRGTVTQLDNWSTWAMHDEWTTANGGPFLNHDVLNKDHANYNYAQALVRKCIADYPQINFTPAVLSRLQL